MLDSTGAVVANGSYSIRFSIYDAASGGNRLWTATGTVATPVALSVTVTDGLFTILLGDNSTGTTQQNALDDTINWNSDSLYLGVTIASDSEMTPRKRLSSAPYAFNAQRLQGMYASSSAFGSSSLFTINQTSNTAATGTRTALEIRSSGTSTPNDFLLLGVNDLSATVFSVNRVGSVTTTSLYASQTVSSTGVFANTATFGGLVVSSTTVCLSNGVGCTAGNEADTLATVTDRGSSATATLQLYGGFLASSSTVTSTFTVVGGTSLQGTTFASATGTSFSLSGRVNSDLLPQTDLAYSLGLTALRWNGAFGHVTATTVTTTNLFASNLSVNNFSSLNVTTTNLSVSGTLSLAYASGTDPGVIATVEIPADETVVDLVVADRHVYALGTGVLRVWDVTNPAAPTTTATSSVFGGESMALEGRYLYVNSGASGFQIFDITSADRPFVVGSSTESFAGERTFVRGGYMYIGNNIYDVHDPRSIDLVATTINAVTFFTDGFLQGKVYFQVRSSGSSELQMWDVSDPYRPVVIASAALAYTPDQITVQGGYAYIGVSGSDEIHVYDIGDLQNVYEVSSFTGNGEMQAAGRYLYTSGLQIFDVMNPLSPTLVKVIPLTESPIAVSGRYAYVASSGVTDYFHVVDLGGIETPALSSALAEIGYLQVRADGRVGGNFTITGSLHVGAGGVQVDGPFMVNASNTTSSVAGSIAFEQNATVGTSTYTDQLHSLFAMSGDDLFVAGNIGSVSSVYTNGAFIAGTGTTMFGDGFVHRTNGNMSLSSSGGYYLPAADLGTRLGSASLRFHGYFGDTTSTNATTTAFAFTAAKGTTSTITLVNVNNLNFNIATGSSVTTTALFATSFQATSGTVTTLSAGSFNANTLTIGGLSALQTLTFTNATGTGVTSTYGYFSNTVSSTQLFANSAVFGTSTVAGKGVCLSDGTYCAAAAASADLNWTFNGASGGFVYNATATTDIVFGSTATSSGASAYFDLNRSVGGSSTIYFGFATLTNVVLGGTSTTNLGLNGLFRMNGDDFFTSGNIGSASSIYTNGGFIAGSGTAMTFYGSQSIMNTSATFTITSTSGTQFQGGITQEIDSFFYASPTQTAPPGALASFFNPLAIAIEGDRLYLLEYVTDGALLAEFDISVRQRPAFVATSTVSGAASVFFRGRGIAVRNQFMYVPDDGKVQVYNVATATTPILLGEAADSGGLIDFYSRVFIKGNTLFACMNQNENTLLTFDIANARKPIYLNAASQPFAQTGGGSGMCDEEDGYHYGITGASGTLALFDVRAPAELTLAYTTTVFPPAASGSSAVKVRGNYAYVTRSSNGLQVIDISDKSHFRTVGSHASGNGSMVLVGDYLITDSLHVFDVSDPANPTLIRTLTGYTGATDQILYDGYLYKVVNTNKIQVHNFNGLDTYGIRAGVASIGQLTVNGTGFFNEDVRIVGGLDVGIKGILSSGGISVAVSSTTGTTSFVNYGVDTIGRAWGAYINTLSVGTSTSATGSLHHSMILTYSSSTRGGLCIDDISTASTCPSQVGYSLVADGPIGASGFDLAERYATTGTVESADLVSLTSVASSTVMRSSGIPYDPKLIGIISSSPGFTLGIYDGEQVALTGRVPTKVSTVNGPIRIGDPLTSSIYPGIAMKATKPGMIVGYALDDADTTSTIEVFVNVGYNAGSILATDGTISEVRDNLVFAATAIASSTSPTADSLGLTFRGSAYNTSTSELSTPSFTLLTDVQSSVTSVFAFRNASGTNVASLTQQGDLSIAGRLFLSARGTPQDQFYMYLDDSLAPTSTYIATNANGFQANSSYDLAERYYSPDNLEAGDLVMIRPEGQIHVQRTSGEEHVVIGIVSTQPGFVLGAHTTSSYPIALAGRVPTKVSTMNGSIKAGDAVGPSSIPGVAVKATSGGPIVGYALEAYDAPDVGKVEVFLSAQAALAQTEQEAPQPAVLGASTSNDSPGGFATIQSGATRVHVSFESIGAYPKVFVTPATEAGDWWTEDYSDTGFDIVISSVLPRDVMFGWEVRPLMAGSQLFSSDNTYQALDPLTGQIIPTVQEDAEVTGDEGDVPVDETAAEETGSASSTEPTR